MIKKPDTPYQLNFKASRVFATVCTVMLMLFLSSCLGILSSEPEPTPTPVLGTMTEQPLTGNGVLTCNQTCADQAQCGTADGLGKVVLLSSAGPTLEAHDSIIGENNITPISGHMDVDVIRDGNPGIQSMRFYKVILPEARGEAWVAGFCIQALPQ
ncbi:MAG: hypothetical protein AAGD96_18335 [Chloroflexota bacterium]